MKMVRSKVAGVSFANDDGSSRQRIIRKYCRAGKTLEVRLEPDNRYSDDAMGLWVRGRWLLVFPAGYQVGYIRNEIATEIRQDVVRGSPISVRILDVTGGGWFRKQYYGVNIEIRVGVGDEFDNDRPQPNRRPAKPIAPKRILTEPPVAAKNRLWPSLKAGATRFLSYLAANLARIASALAARFRALSVFQKVIASGFSACVVGAVIWALGCFMGQTLALFSILRPTGVVIVIVGLGTACLGAVFYLTE